MKKTVIISAIALAFSLTSVNATSDLQKVDLKISVTETYDKPNALCMSIVKGDLEMVEKLIELGADINERSAGMTPVIYAARYNKVEILKLLISKGADLKKKCNRGMTAINHAEIAKATDTKELIEKTLKKKK